MATDRPKGPVVDWDKVARLLLRSLPILPAPEIYDLLKDLQQSRGQLDQKVKRAASALHDASTLVAELQGELTEKVDQVAKLKVEYERYQQLSTIEEQKAKALIEQLHLALGTGRSRERWIAFAINLAAGITVFLLGVWLSPWIRRLFGIAV